MIEKIEEILNDYSQGLLTCNERKFQIETISHIIADNFDICHYVNGECKNCFNTINNNNFIPTNL